MTHAPFKLKYRVPQSYIDGCDGKVPEVYREISELIEPLINNADHPGDLPAVLAMVMAEFAVNNVLYSRDTPQRQLELVTKAIHAMMQNILKTYKHEFEKDIMSLGDVDAREDKQTT